MFFNEISHIAASYFTWSVRGSAILPLKSKSQCNFDLVKPKSVIRLYFIFISDVNFRFLHVINPFWCLFRLKPKRIRQ